MAAENYSTSLIALRRISSERLASNEQEATSLYRRYMEIKFVYDAVAPNFHEESARIIFEGLPRTGGWLHCRQLIVEARMWVLPEHLGQATPSNYAIDIGHYLPDFFKYRAPQSIGASPYAGLLEVLLQASRCEFNSLLGKIRYDTHLIEYISTRIKVL